MYKVAFFVGQGGWGDGERLLRLSIQGWECGVGMILLVEKGDVGRFGSYSRLTTVVSLARSRQRGNPKRSRTWKLAYLFHALELGEQETESFLALEKCGGENVIN